MATLYVVSTPIGNLDDITLRALAVLKDVDRVLAEDTRRTSILFRRYDIATPLVSAHEHNEAARAQQLVGWLDGGEDVALVSDAGTPLLSDPGARLVRAVLEAGHGVVPVPGASALLSALVISGLPAEPFTFYGFVPRSGRARRELLAELSGLRHTAVLYESPARLTSLLRDLIDACGADRPAAVARELTKLHESLVRGTLADALRTYEGGTVRGEVVVVLGGAPAAERPAVTDAAVLAAELLAGGATPRSAARELAQRLRMSRNDAYSLVLAAREGGRDKE
ncbi:MAG TPA: 16S rRNA (cytidine(1402)-2'-O)-methyltransferase [Longimicrobiales bacterium]